MRMVPLATTRSAFEAQVLAARLGSEGILWQVRGGGADAMYPIGSVDVLVAADDLERACEVLGALDEEGVEPSDEGVGSDRTEWWMAVVVVGLLLAFVALRIFSL